MFSKSQDKTLFFDHVFRVGCLVLQNSTILIISYESPNFNIILIHFISSESRITVSPEEETLILIHSLRDANLPKFLAEDVPLFESIMTDLFPGVDPPHPRLEVLEVFCLHHIKYFVLFLLLLFRFITHC